MESWETGCERIVFRDCIGCCFDFGDCFDDSLVRCSKYCEIHNQETFREKTLGKRAKQE